MGLEDDEDGAEDGDDAGSSEDIENLPPPRWLYWCTRRHLEWHSSLNQTTDDPVVDVSAGVLSPVEHSKLCVTPGITVGYNIGVEAKDVPVYSHNSLLANIGNTRDCYGNENGDDFSGAPGCLDLVERLLFCALRSRTWTSAGMRNVLLESRYLPGDELMSKLWELLEERFAIDRTRALVTQSFLVDHRKQIAYENLLGQCTSGHSCKEEAKNELRRIAGD